MKILVFDNVGEAHERISTNLIIDIANIGGLVEIAFVFAWGIYLFFGQPFKDIDLALSFNKLNNKVKPEKDWGQVDMTDEYEKKMTFCFYIQWYLY